MFRVSASKSSFKHFTFCESHDKISTLRQKRAQYFCWKFSQHLSLIFFYICEEFVGIFMHELVKIADASITGLEKCHPRIIGYSERVSKLVAKYRIIVFFFKYLTKNVIIGLRWNPGNNLLLSLTSLSSGAQTGGNTPHLLSATRSCSVCCS